MAPVVKGRMAAAEEVESGAWIGGKRRVILQLEREFSLQGRIRVEYGSGYLLRHIGLDLFLLLEAGVEEPPGGEGIRSLRLEERHDEP